MNGNAQNLIVKPPVPLLFAAVIVGGLFYVAGQYVASQPQRTEKETDAKREIMVTGRGEAHGKPDIARITLGVQTTTQPNAAGALDILGKRTKAVIGALRALGIKEDDITTTNLSISPRYDFSNGRQTLRGFEASESVEVKIRDLTKIGEVVSRTTAEGVNQVGGIAFEMDDPDTLQTAAEEDAIADARGKATRLAGALGVSLGRVKTFSTAVEPPGPHPLFAEARLAAGAAPPTAPEISPGSFDVTTTITITFEIR